MAETIQFFGVPQHGAAQHTDVTRFLWITPRMMTLDAATTVQLGAAPDIQEVIQMADAATQGCYFDFLVPPDWATGAINIVPEWAPSATDAVAHTVRWQFDVIMRTAGQDVTAAGTTTPWTGDSSAKTLNQLQIETGTALITPTNVLQYIRVNLRRLGADGADTYVGAVNLLGVRLTYTATG